MIKEGTLEAQMRIENIEELLNSAYNFENTYEEEIEEPMNDGEHVPNLKVSK